MQIAEHSHCSSHLCQFPQTHQWIQAWTRALRDTAPWLVLKSRSQVFKASSTSSTSSRLSLVMDKPPQLFVAGLSKLEVLCTWLAKCPRKEKTTFSSLSGRLTGRFLQQEGALHRFSRVSGAPGFCERVMEQQQPFNEVLGVPQGLHRTTTSRGGT